MSFTITQQMLGIDVLNAVSGSRLGVSQQILFDAANHSFKYWVVKNPDNGELYYLQYADILSLNSSVILCIFDGNFDDSYDYRRDDSVCLYLGREARNLDRKELGIVSSLELDPSSSRISSFYIEKDESIIKADISKFDSDAAGQYLVFDCELPEPEEKPVEIRAEEKKPVKPVEIKSEVEFENSKTPEPERKLTKRKSGSFSKLIAMYGYIAASAVMFYLLSL